MIFAKVICIYNEINVFLKYSYLISYKNNNVAMKLGLKVVKKYLRYVAEVANKLNNL